ncbi:MAG: hypothetical protein KA175_00840 [Flavobacteriales bacterium]|nr:hypothetical protein [Flavobacteriales bacterium]MBP6696129.1 hypothetical protein [Flavobacteriales bacterium]
MRTSLTWAVLVACLHCTGQEQNNWWYFGEVALDLNSGSPVLNTNSAMDQMEGSASIADAQGNLLFYTDGVTIWNRSDLPMPNGTGLLGHSSSSQSAVIVPKPSSCGIYYVFTVPAQSDVIPLSYSIVDMSLDGGMGDVSIKNIPLYAGVTERLSATLHANGVDYWVAGQRCSDHAMLSFRLTAAGVDIAPVVSPPLLITDACYIGYLKFAPNGTKLCATYLYGYHAVLMDYDNATGTAANPLVLSPFVGSGGYGVEFSAQSSRLYLQSINAPRVLVQYDMLAGDTADIRASRFLVDSTGIVDLEYVYGGALQMTPYGSIYVNRLNKPYLAIVQYPDQLGAACGYVDQAIDISPLECQDGLPNLLPIHPSCEAQVGIPESNPDAFSIGPNPASSLVEIVGVAHGLAIVTDAAGREIDRLWLTGGRAVLDVSHFANGWYLVKMSNKTARLMVQH